MTDQANRRHFARLPSSATPPPRRKSGQRRDSFKLKPASPIDHSERAAKILVAYVSHNSIPSFEVPKLLVRLHGEMVRLDQANVSVSERHATASVAQIRASIKRDVLISFIDGKGYKSLKRHLAAHGLSPQSYRARYGLPIDYPMISESYAARRSALAKRAWLGEISLEHRDTLAARVLLHTDFFGP